MTIAKYTLGIAGLLLAHLATGSSLAALWQVDALICTVGLCCSLSLLSKTPKELLSILNDHHVADTVAKNFLWAGLIGFLIGLTQIVRYLNTPDLVGPATAFATTSLLYGLFGYLLIGPPMAATHAPTTDLSHLSQEHPRRLYQVCAGILTALVIIVSFSLAFSWNHLHFLSDLPAFVAICGGAILALARTQRSPTTVTGQSVADAVLATGALGGIFHFIHVMENLDRPEAILEGLAQGLLPFFYSVVIATMIQTAIKPREPTKKLITTFWIITLAGLSTMTSLIMFALS